MAFASHWTLAIPGICVFPLLSLFLLVVIATYVRHTRHRFPKTKSGCSSSKINEIRRFVLPQNGHQCLFAIAFLLLNIVPITVSAQSGQSDQDTCIEGTERALFLSSESFSQLGLNCKSSFLSLDCGGHFWDCTSSSCFASSNWLNGWNNWMNTWSEAVEICSLNGGALLSFKGEEEENAVPAIIGDDSYFFGLIRRPTAATGVYSYRWSDGSPLTYAHWNELGLLNEKTSCGKLVISDSEIHWRAESCSNRLPFVCIKPRSESCSFFLYL